MADLTDYTVLITSEHSDKPRFMASVSALVQPLVEQMNVLESMPGKFDLDNAVGVQLDDVGLWVGVSRKIRTPLTGVYFSFDIAGLGFDQGTWKGPFDPDTGLTILDDDTYRLVIRAKIGANHWDGTLQQSAAILNSIFDADTHVFIEDHQDMSMTIGIAGKVPPATFLALLSGGYIPLKPEGVRVNYTIVTTVDGSPLFGFDMSNQLVAGFDVGAWSRPV
ncbi:DUF2612 domain-containing protein [Burkholderia pseudomallei]|uniref:DUF2612 domain-containing protein n=1 Tax=pseudomallei group TaxID=111527 RepID=UPI000162B047|nr:MULTISPECIES: DUF2612 domain-containing protein [pseudomallei group]ABY40546.1 hypothetical protein 3.10 [Burkholderia phage Bups phi1]AHE29890.1 hypothetical protein BBJ_5451 [Burkholderia pseudomallei NCTC 13178]AIS96254.1 hypothetical protein BTHA_2673 [Burkholderia thailandensis MSMB59]AOJ44889.1 hypothetical protein WJ27_07050 [Burkholderia thailandensis]KGC67715.1 hypothetical protein DP57_2399 [Burkholderia pseudomallei]